MTRLALISLALMMGCYSSFEPLPEGTTLLVPEEGGSFLGCVVVAAPVDAGYRVYVPIEGGFLDILFDSTYGYEASIYEGSLYPLRPIEGRGEPLAVVTPMGGAVGPVRTEDYTIEVDLRADFPDRTFLVRGRARVGVGCPL